MPTFFLVGVIPKLCNAHLMVLIVYLSSNSIFRYVQNILWQKAVRHFSAQGVPHRTPLAGFPSGEGRTAGNARLRLPSSQKSSIRRYVAVTVAPASTG